MAVDLAFAASGVFQYALFGRPKIWDVAAGVLLVKEAGGTTLVRRGRQGWHPLDRFEPSGDEKQPDGKLQDWSRQLLVGAPETVTSVARDLRGPPFRLGLPTWLKRGGNTRDASDGSGRRSA